MFKKLFGALDAARTMFVGSPSLIREGLAGLELIDKTLAARAAAFVADGSDETILLDLRAHAPDAGKLLGHPGRLGSGFYHYDQDNERTAAIKAGMAARDKLYRSVGPDSAQEAMLGRLGKVFEAADQGVKLDRPGPSAPDWLQYLLNDALWACYDDYNHSREQPGRAGWDIRLLLAILSDTGLPSAMALPIVFERRGVDAYYQSNVYVSMVAPGALDEHMLAHPADVALAVKTLSSVGRVLLCKRIGTNPALLARYAALLVQMAVSDSKTVRASAASYLDGVPRESCGALLAELLRNGQGEERVNAAQLLARLQGIDAVATLEAALAGETSKPVQQAIRFALSSLHAAGDGARLELPSPPELPPFEETTLADDALDVLLANRQELIERLRKGAEDEAEENRSRKTNWGFRQAQYDGCRSVSDQQLGVAILALNGHREALPVLQNDAVRQILDFGHRLEARSDCGLVQLLRWHFAVGNSGSAVWHDERFRRWLQRQDLAQVDLRQLSFLVARCGGDADNIALSCLRQNWQETDRPQHVLPPERIWPLFAVMPELIDEGLGLAGADRGLYQGLELGSTLSVLETFPVVPARWLPRVMELALGEGKTNRLAAQRVLDKLPDIGNRICESLKSSKQELRIEAARWLARLGYRAGIPALYAALDKEARETVSAELMAALEHLGEDLAPRLAPALLLKQAQKGLKARPPAGLAWFNLDLLPACRWLDGAALEPDILRWWVILACKLKEPAANPLLQRYLGLLDQPSRAALGRFMLHQFIAQDTRHPPLDEAIAWANQHAPIRYQQNQAWAIQYPQYGLEAASLTEEQVFEQVKREKLGEYLGSAIGEKGLLALAFGTPGHELVAAIQHYMRDHYPRRAQVEALLEAACVSDEAAVIQFVLSIARRYRTASVQLKARALVERIAERNGWTEDQLADRTIPTGGLDESGRLALRYGARDYTVVLDPALKLVLHNSEGKVVAALPAPRQDDPPDAIKEAKALLTACKKEVKQVLDMQSARLYEAMCAGRAWPAAEWNEFLRQHPVVGRLVQRLVWVERSPEGGIERLFRPTEDGSLVDIDDDEVELGGQAQIGLAHGSMLTPDQVKRWLAHFKDYKVAPLFAQLNRGSPPPTGRTADRIDDRQGWISDTFTLRGAFNKLGYQRGAAEDGGVFMEYYKDFTSAGIRVRIEFSGSALPEEKLPAALTTLGFHKLSARSGYGAPLAIGDVPPVLLAEAYGDYHAVAAACLGFDPEWQRKMPW